MYSLLKATAEKNGYIFHEKYVISVSIKSPKFQNITGDDNLLCVTPEVMLSLRTGNSVLGMMTTLTSPDLEPRW